MSDALTRPTLEIDDDPEAFFELSLAEGWGDGAPLLPPTDERVEALLEATALAPSHVIGKLPPRHGVATVELVAINSAMAGVEPAAFPLVIAALEALVRPEFNAIALTTTTSSVHPALIVNGPSRDKLRIDYGAGCLGGAAGRGSMTIGRAVSLCLRNVGGQRTGATSRSVFGQPARFGQCFAEWEERSPWPTLAERQGFARDRDVVTLHGSKGDFPVADTNNDDPRDLACMLAKCIAYPLSNYYLELTGDCGQIVVVINPMWAARFAKAFDGIASFQEYLREHAWQPIDLWRPANQEVLRRKSRVDAQGRVYLVNRPEQLVPVVAGGLGSLHAMFLPSWCQSEMQSAAVHGATWTSELLEAALDEARALVRSDGADLLLVEADTATARVVLKLDVGDETCATGACVMPGEALRPMIADVLSRRLRGALDLRLIDPRVS